MPKMTLNRTYVLRTIHGVVSFQKGEPVWVPPAMEVEAAQIGAERADGVEVDLIPEAPKVKLTPSEPERADQIVAAFKRIVDNNDSKDFTAAGVPTAKAVERLVGFSVERSEINVLWAAEKAKAE